MSLPRELFMTVVAVGLVLFALDALLTPRRDVRNFELFPEMVHALAFESFSASPELANGIVQQPLEAGVVTRDHTPFPYGSGPEEAVRAGAELKNPLSSTPADLDRGRELYGIFCAVCHDAKGNGRGPVIARGMLPPPSLLADRAMQLPDGSLFHILTRGQGNMASYAAQTSVSDRWRIVLWIRQLQGGSR